MIVLRMEVLHARIALKNPYLLSFATVSSIDSVIVRIDLNNGGVGLGEAVPLPGYSLETLQSIQSDLENVIDDLVGKNISEISLILKRQLSDSPFAMSAILTALEIASGSFVISKNINIPLVAPVSSHGDKGRTIGEMWEWYEAGYRTIKLKVGRNITDDCLCLRKLIDALPKQTKLRVDANQGYSPAQARQLLAELKNDSAGVVEVIEQPFGIHEWKEFEKLVHDFPGVPLMLDESILSDSDVDKAIDVGASFIKLKLFKHQGPKHVMTLIKRAINSGLGVVFGNGVCSDLGYLIEASIFQSLGLCLGAFEGNGFEKLVVSSVSNSPIVERGSIIWNVKPNFEFNSFLNSTIYSSINKKC